MTTATYWILWGATIYIVYSHCTIRLRARSASTCIDSCRCSRFLPSYFAAGKVCHAHGCPVLCRTRQVITAWTTTCALKAACILAVVTKSALGRPIHFRIPSWLTLKASGQATEEGEAPRWAIEASRHPSCCSKPSHAALVTTRSAELRCKPSWGALDTLCQANRLSCRSWPASLASCRSQCIRKETLGAIHTRCFAFSVNKTTKKTGGTLS
mmetsp:Transcript_58199/g.136099  ORF Transcript_58199/g.136099 Transcript_58199/m.136099 type:complete len:212 (-) Transcript_58199:37-672(-)